MAESAGFSHFGLRTTDVDAAQAFYTDVLGEQIWGSHLFVSLLPARAAMMGAPAHWLGHIGMGDLQESVDRALALGAQPLGPVQSSPDGSPYTVLRDPTGAVFALRSKSTEDAHHAVAWHLLHAHDHARAFGFYAALFGWSATEVLDLGVGNSRHQMFAWDGSGRNAGSVANTARLPAVHPHWLFHFLTADIEGALARARDRGAKAWPPVRTPAGELVAPCEDPQGAAFALCQSAHPFG